MGTDVNKENPIFFNHSFDKKRLKALISWVFKKSGEAEALKVIDLLKETGFRHATKAGISIGLHDLSTPIQKSWLISESQLAMNTTERDFIGARITATERSQRIIDTWHRASESLSKQVVDYFGIYDRFNPVYIMALSGARGNFSQVRQLIGMRGLMADQQGKIVNFPIRSNLREGLTLTEYFISCSGARKGLVDTALRTADTGYLTRRLVDVSHHVVVKRIRCNTNRGIAFKSLQSYNKILLALKERLVGRVLAEDVWLKNEDVSSYDPCSPFSKKALVCKTKLQQDLVSQIDAKQEMAPDLETSHSAHANRRFAKEQSSKAYANLLTKLSNKSSICKRAPNFVLPEQRLEGFLEERVAKKDQEISLKLALKIAKIRDKVYLRSPLTCGFTHSVCQLCYGWSISQGSLVSLGDAVGVIAAQSIGEPGTQLTMRTFHTGGVFSGDLLQEIKAPHAGKIEFAKAFQGLLIRTAHGRIAFLSKTEGSLVLKCTENENKKSNTFTTIPIPAFTMLFVRQGERVENNQLLAEFSIRTKEGNQPIKTQQTILAELSGRVIEDCSGKVYTKSIKESAFLLETLESDVPSFSTAQESPHKSYGDRVSCKASNKSSICFTSKANILSGKHNSLTNLGEIACKSQSFARPCEQESEQPSNGLQSDASKSFYKSSYQVQSLCKSKICKKADKLCTCTRNFLPPTFTPVEDKKSVDLGGAKRVFSNSLDTPFALPKAYIPQVISSFSSYNGYISAKKANDQNSCFSSLKTPRKRRQELFRKSCVSVMEKGGVASNSKNNKPGLKNKFWFYTKQVFANERIKAKARTESRVDLYAKTNKTMRLGMRCAQTQQLQQVKKLYSCLKTPNSLPPGFSLEAKRNKSTFLFHFYKSFFYWFYHLSSCKMIFKGARYKSSRKMGTLLLPEAHKSPICFQSFANKRKASNKAYASTSTKLRFVRRFVSLFTSTNLRFVRRSVRKHTKPLAYKSSYKALLCKTSTKQSFVRKLERFVTKNRQNLQSLHQSDRFNNQSVLLRDNKQFSSPIKNWNVFYGVQNEMLQKIFDTKLDKWSTSNKRFICLNQVKKKQPCTCKAQLFFSHKSEDLESDTFKYIEPVKSGRLGFLKILSTRVGATLDYISPIRSFDQRLQKRKSLSVLKTSFSKKMQDNSLQSDGKMGNADKSSCVQVQKTFLNCSVKDFGRAKDIPKGFRKESVFFSSFTGKYLHPESIKENRFCLQTIAEHGDIVEEGYSSSNLNFKNKGNKKGQ